MQFNAKNGVDFPIALASDYLDHGSKAKDVLGIIGVFGKMDAPLTIFGWFAPSAEDIATQPQIISTQVWINLMDHPPYYNAHYLDGYGKATSKK
jgi:hypothetical protein